MISPVAQSLTSLKAGAPRRHGALAIVPLRERHPRPSEPRYLTSGEALGLALGATVSEVSAEGTVPVLKISVRGELPVLFVEGEVLSGGKQTRILNTSVLARPNGDTEIPVSCVEQGRWHAKAAHFGASRSFGSPELRRAKNHSVAENLGRSTVASVDAFRSNQGEVWAQVGRELTQAGAQSATHSFEEVRASREERLGAYSAELLPALDGAVGFVALIGGMPVGFDVFERPEILRVIAPRCLEGYALDALDRADPGLDEWALRTLAKAFLKCARRASSRTFPSPGLGEDHRFECERLRGFALEHEGRVVHAAAFPS